jgi:undecaprenyl-diphosphatase
VFALALVAGFVAFIAVSVLVGTLLTDVALDVGWIRAADEGAVRALVERREPALTEVSTLVSDLGGGPVLASLAGLMALVAAARRSWLTAAFIALLLPLETAAYRLTLNLVPRLRPGVERLDGLPVGGSYPSGHTAASIAVYAGLTLLLASSTSRRSVRRTALAVAVAMPVLVAVSRVYRGMHHPLDTLGGALVGVGTLAVVLVATRAAATRAEMEKRTRAT